MAALLVEAGRSPDPIELGIQPLVVRDGTRVLLFDTGAGDASFAKAGRLPQALREAGIAPTEVTDVFLSHRHPDHVGAVGDLGSDARTAEASRRALLERASKENLRLYAGHFPFPGLGRVQRRGESFVWGPEASAPSTVPQR